MSKIKIPRHLKSKLKDIGKKNGFSGAKDIARHLVDKGLHRYDVQEGAKLEDQIEAIADEKGYSSADEVVEHLLEIGLAAWILKGPMTSALAGVQIALVGGFTLTLSALEPALLVHPSLATLDLSDNLLGDSVSQNG